jgi:hypothetical protein
MSWVVVREFLNADSLETPLTLSSYATQWEAERAAKVFADAFPDLMIGGAVFKVVKINTSN